MSKLIKRSIKSQIGNVSCNKFKGEKWLPIKLFEKSHLCSNYGRILSLDRELFSGRSIHIHAGRLLKPFIDKEGYMNIVIVCNGFKKRLKVHRIVADCFIKSVDKTLDVDHIDFNKQNNHCNNLRYVSKYENTIHSALNGKYKNNATELNFNRNGKMTFQFDKNGVFLSKYNSLGEAARSVNGRKNMISRAIIGRSKTAYGYKWSYSL